MTLTPSFTIGALLITAVAAFLILFSAAVGRYEPKLAWLLFILGALLTLGLYLIGVNLQ